MQNGSEQSRSPYFIPRSTQRKNNVAAIFCKTSSGECLMMYHETRAQVHQKMQYR